MLNNTDGTKACFALISVHFDDNIFRVGILFVRDLPNLKFSWTPDKATLPVVVKNVSF